MDIFFFVMFALATAYTLGSIVWQINDISNTLRKINDKLEEQNRKMNATTRHGKT